MTSDSWKAPIQGQQVSNADESSQTVLIFEQTMLRKLTVRAKVATNICRPIFSTQKLIGEARLGVCGRVKSLLWVWTVF